MSLGLREYHQRALRANVGGVTCRGMATEMGITDFSTATQWRALAVEALQGPQTTRLSRLQAAQVALGWRCCPGRVPGVPVILHSYSTGISMQVLAQWQHALAYSVSDHIRS